MARKKKFDGGKSTKEYTQAYLKEQGEKALLDARNLEKIQINEGKVWIKEGKAMVLRSITN
ncbi:hypothetical protein [Tenacibaculum caenipelagi]|uniref:Uncharacterized protein n=1 Tax=Tenacibaculum caenipelagi TaxID=1325435 RepID=A0A4R6TIJ1_9FLAO|nr:hypothetical protein [Tenacibaculum caenipelagi]TDQ27671.1 hypothetical protein DFQ07_1522 [Tenacibaculum caenipelagi]